MSLTQHLSADNATEVSNMIGDGDSARLPAALRRPKPQPCNQIPPTYAEAIGRLHAGHLRWPRLRLWIGRAVRRLMRVVLWPKLRVIVREFWRRRRDLDAAMRRARA